MGINYREMAGQGRLGLLLIFASDSSKGDLYSANAVGGEKEKGQSRLRLLSVYSDPGAHLIFCFV